MSANTEESVENSPEKSLLKNALAKNTTLFDSSKSINQSKSNNSNSLYSFGEELVNIFFQSGVLYELEDVIAEYNALNTDLLSAMERIDDIFMVEYANASDIKFLNKLKISYTKRAIRKYRKDNTVLNHNIFSNVLNSTLKETHERCFWFFNNDDSNRWEERVNQYRNTFIKFGGKYTAQLIQFTNTLYSNLIDLHNDFTFNESSFQANFNFTYVLNLSEKYTDPGERKYFFHCMILYCNQMCLSGEITDIKDGEQDEFISKCQKAIDIIEMEEKLLNPAKTAESSPAIEMATIPDNTEIPLNTLPESDITLNRQFLALYYMLNAIDNQSFSRNKSEIARFIHMLTGKSYENIYKKVKNPMKDPADKISKKYQDDIHFLVETFKNLGLISIARSIESDNLIG